MQARSLNPLEEGRVLKVPFVKRKLLLFKFKKLLPLLLLGGKAKSLNDQVIPLVGKNDENENPSSIITINAEQLLRNQNLVRDDEENQYYDEDSNTPADLSNALYYYIRNSPYQYYTVPQDFEYRRF